MEENFKYIIGLDGMGGDNAPVATVQGLVDAINENADLKVKVYGKEDALKEELKKYKYNEKQVEIVNCSEVIENCEVPNEVIRKKKDSSMVVGFNELKEEKIDGFVSAGSTGAVLMGGFMKIGRIKGVSRPATAPLLPTAVENKQVLLIDCGANIETKPMNLVHFAVMGSVVMRSAYGIKEPKVGLLNIGAEEQKGTPVLKEAYQLLEKTKGINFVGNIEPRYGLSGEVDVIVADGVSGNIFLKTVEGTAKFFSQVLKNSIKKYTMSKIGYLFAKKSFNDIKDMMNYHKYGGSLFVGAKGVIIKSHGSSNALSISTSINQAIKYKKFNLQNEIKKAIEEVNAQFETEE